VGPGVVVDLILHRRLLCLKSLWAQPIYQTSGDGGPAAGGGVAGLSWSRVADEWVVGRIGGKVEKEKGEGGGSNPSLFVSMSSGASMAACT
jgi:hypothetical protein